MHFVCNKQKWNETRNEVKVLLMLHQCTLKGVLKQNLFFGRGGGVGSCSLVVTNKEV